MTIKHSRAPIGRPVELMACGLRVAAVTSLIAFAGCVEEPQKVESPPPEVTVVTLEAQPVSLTTELPGRTRAYRIAEVRPQVGGVIQERLFTEGADVEAGQKLYQIDSRRFAAALDRANANVKRAQADLEHAQYELRRLTKLTEGESVAEKELQDAFFAEQAADAALDLALSEHRTAALNLEWTGVVAPIPGRIGYSAVTEGALVTADQPTPLTTIQQIDPMYVDVTQSSTELLRLKRRLQTGELSADGDRRAVRLILEDGTPYPLEGTLQFRDVTVDSTTGCYTLRIVFANPQRLLLPGMFVRAVVQEGTAEQALLVPQQGVSRNPKGEAVALVVDNAGQVQQRILTLDRALGNRWLVSAGLRAGERLIIEGAIRVRPGDSVTVVSSDGEQQRATEESQPIAGPR